MKIFVTGGTGYIGAAVVRELVSAGHDVTALARDGGGAERIRKWGAEHVEGALSDAQTLTRTADGHDAAIHLAQDREADDRLTADRVVLDALSRALPRDGGILVYTSNAFLLGDQGLGPLQEDERWSLRPQWGAWRLDAEEHALSLGERGLRTAVIRPGQVYGGTGGTLPMLFESAERDGAAAYVGNGANRWSMVHREDLARLFRTVVEERAGGIYHGVDGTPVPVREIARAVSEAAGRQGRVRSIPLQEARAEMGGFADMLVLDVSVGNRAARSLGWEPRHRPFPDSAASAYREWKAAGD